MSQVGIADWGPLVVETDVDQAILTQLQTWYPTYVAQMSTERNLGYELPMPRHYSNTLEESEFLDNQIPGVYVTTAEARKTQGGANSIYMATWSVKMSVVVRGRRPTETRLNASLMSGALRRCFLQKCKGPVVMPSGFVNLALSDPHWEGSSVGPLKDGTGEGRYLAAGMGQYNVSTDAAAQGFGGPDVPGATSYVPLATVTDVEINVESEE